MTEFDRHGIVYTTARAVKNSKKDRIKKLLTKQRQHDILSKLLLSNTKSEAETLRKNFSKKCLTKSNSSDIMNELLMRTGNRLNLESERLNSV